MAAAPLAWTRCRHGSVAFVGLFAEYVCTAASNVHASPRNPRTEDPVACRSRTVETARQVGYLCTPVKDYRSCGNIVCLRQPCVSEPEKSHLAGADFELAALGSVALGSAAAGGVAAMTGGAFRTPGSASGVEGAIFASTAAA